MDILKTLIENWDKIGEALYILYELLVRLIPTKKNYSLIDKLIPNRKTKLVITFLLLSFSADAQIWQSFKGIWFPQYDTITSAPGIPSGYGAITAANDSLYGYDGSGWFNLHSSGGGGSTSFGQATQIPFMNGTDDNFSYSDSLIFTGQSFYTIATNDIGLSAQQGVDYASTSLIAGLSIETKIGDNSSYAGTNTTLTSHDMQVYDGVLGELTEISIQPSSIQARSDDFANFPGITYDFDYSANYTDLSVPNWGNVLRNGSTSTLVSTTTIDMSDQTLNITGVDNALGTGFNISADYSSFFSGAYDFFFNSIEGYELRNTNTSLAGYFSSVNMGFAGSPIIDLTVEDNGTANDVSIDLSPANIIVSGGSNFDGIVYNIDYSSSYTNRSLVDKEYTDSNFLGATAPAAPGAGQNGQALRWNNGGSTWEYFTPSGSAPTLQENEIAFGSGTNTITSSSDLYYDPAGISGPEFHINDGQFFVDNSIVGFPVNIVAGRMSIHDDQGADQGSIIVSGAGIKLGDPVGSQGWGVWSGGPDSASNAQASSFYFDVNNNLFIKTSNAAGKTITIDVSASSGGEIIMTGLRTSCAGAPSGAIADISGVLNRCP